MEIFAAILMAMLVIICFFTVTFAVKYVCGRYFAKRDRADHGAPLKKTDAPMEKRKRKP